MREGVGMAVVVAINVIMLISDSEDVVDAKSLEQLEAGTAKLKVDPKGY